MLVGILSVMNVALESTVSNIHLGFQLQAVVSIALILYAMLFDRFSRRVHVAAGAFCVVSLSFAAFLGVYGNLNNVSYEEDVVIVLGAGVRGETVSLHLANRLNKAVDYLYKNPGAYVVVTGGLGGNAVITEAEAMERYLIARGIAPERIIQEDQSTSTYENLSFARDILSERFPQGFSAVLISNDFHIYRATRIARHVGVPARGYGAITPRTALVLNYLREMSAVAHMWVFTPI